MCTVDYLGTAAGDDWTLSSSCFQFVEVSTCSSDSDCRAITHGGSQIIACCCFEDNCLNASSQVFEFLSSATGVSVESSRSY